MIEASTHIIDCWADFERLKKYTSEVKSDLFFVDVETDSEIEKLAKLYGIGICFTNKRAFYIVVRRQDGTKVWTDSQEKAIADYILETARTKKLINHNILYDVLVLENNLGIVLDDYVYADTMMLKHTLNEEPPHGLKENAQIELGDWAVSAQEDMKASVIKNGGKWNKKKKDMYLSDTDILAKYCMWDVLLTLELYKIFSKRLKEENLEQFFYQDEVMPLYKECTIPMKRHGFPVDKEHFKTLKKELEEKINTLEEEIVHELKDEIKPFISKLIDKEVPVKNSGNLPKIIAERLNIPLPIKQTKNKETGEITEAVTLAAKALESQLAATPEYSNFYNWVLGKGELDLSEEVLFSIREKAYVSKKNKAAEKKDKHIKYAFNLNSSDHLAYYFFTLKGYAAKEKTEGGKNKLNASFIDDLKAEDPIAQKIIDYKKLQKLLNTYVIGFLKRIIDDRIYTSMLQHGTTSGRYSSTNPNCLSMDTQILTNSGWKYHADLLEIDTIACFDENSRTITFNNYTNKWKSILKKQSMVSIENQHIHWRMTENHRCLLRNRKTDELKTVPAAWVKEDYYVLHGANYDGEFEENEDFLKLIIATQADGELRKDNNKRIRFVFSKERKYNRLLDILNNLGFEYSLFTKGGYKFGILVKDPEKLVYNYLGESKTFPKSWINLSLEQKKLVIEELFHWDGCFTRKQNYSSNNETNVDIIQAMASLCGYRAHKRIYFSKTATAPNYQLDFCFRDYSLTTNMEINTFSSDEEVWCVEVPTGYFVARRGSDTFITGNCQNLPRLKDEESDLSPLVLHYVNLIKQGLVAPKRGKIVNADFSQLEPCCFATASGDPKLQEIFHKKEDLYSRIAIDVFEMTHLSADKKAPNFLKKVSPEFRSKSKVFTLAIPYGAEAARISQAMSVDYKEANKTINAYLSTYPDLKKYMMRCNALAKKEGKVVSAFGRVRHLPRAKELYEKYGNDLLDWKWAKGRGLLAERREFKTLLNNAKNFPIQSMAASIVNRSMIAMARKLKELGLDAYIALQIHDEISTIANRAEDAELIKTLLRDCMENTCKIAVPLVAEPIIADNMAEAK